ncbi:PREDICTED: protein FAM192A [Ceratosolen solmsi marchali]|uniref:Protein FAM192A n=1 Tax=Ceratosolen solmsi marchali TaxID=326594 RepID=A0AAJ6VM98_9HYME|nr:PREDICTED: protein FAM192A [Ceratosolen solmsi marchali]
MIKGLDDDEIEFLDLVDRTKIEEERKKNLEDEKEMKDFKAAVASLQEKSIDERLKQELKQPHSNNKSTASGNKNSQLRLLAGVIVKKSIKTENKFINSMQGTKRRLSEVENSITENKLDDSQCFVKNPQLETGALKCIAILPGLGSYDNSSDSECSSDEQESECKQIKLDILGRQILEPKAKEDN